MSANDHVKPARAWQRMLSGRRLDLLQPAPEDVAIEDIAHGLARVARWNGQTSGEHAFSVAQHSLLVTDIYEALHPHAAVAFKRAALLHDAPEYVIGDLISPFKSAIGLDYKAFEHRLLAAIHERFDIPLALPDDVTRAIKDADRVAAFFEATRLAGFSIDEGRAFFGTFTLPDDLESALQLVQPLPARAAQAAFLERFTALAPA